MKRPATLLAVNAQLGQQAEVCCAMPASWLGASPTPAVVELLATHLVRYPNAELLRLVFTRLDAAPLPANEAGYRAYCALFCAAGVGATGNSPRPSRVTLKARAGATFVTLNAAEDFFLGQSAFVADRILPARAHLAGGNPLRLAGTFCGRSPVRPSRASAMNASTLLPPPAPAAAPAVWRQPLVLINLGFLGAFTGGAQRAIGGPSGGAIPISRMVSSCQ